MVGGGDGVQEKLFLRCVDDGVGGAEEAGEGWRRGCGVGEELVLRGGGLVGFGGGLGKVETRGGWVEAAVGSARVASEKRRGTQQVRD